MGTKHTEVVVLDEIRRLFEFTTLTYQEIADMLRVSRKVVHRCVHNSFSKESITTRKKKNYCASKVGDKNPMKGKFGEKHHNYKGIISDGKGYHLILKPSWYTGKKGSKHIFLHHKIICKHLGLTCIPKGFAVHHINGNPLNNSVENLQLLTMSAHTKLHCEKRAETIPTGSRVLENSKRGAALIR